MRKALQLCGALAVVFFALSPAAEASTCMISQECDNGSLISCSGPAGTCTSGTNYVQCNGTRTYCPPECSGGDRYLEMGCCSNGRVRHDYQICQNGYWVTQYIMCGQLGCEV